MYPSARVSKVRAKLHPPKQTKTNKQKTAPTHSLVLFGTKTPPGQHLFCLLPNRSTVPRAQPLPALHPFIPLARRAPRPAGRPALQLPPSTTGAALRAQGCEPRPPGPSLPAEEGAGAGAGKPGPTSCRVRAGRAPGSLRGLLRARGAGGAAAPTMRRGAGRGTLGPGRGEPRPRGPAPPPERPRRREG